MRNIICCFFDHKILEAYSELKHIGCPHWDNCDIEEHQMVDIIYKCQRCDFTTIKRVHLYQLHPPITKISKCDNNA